MTFLKLSLLNSALIGFNVVAICYGSPSVVFLNWAAIGFISAIWMFEFLQWRNLI